MVDKFAIIFKHIVEVLKPETVYKTSVTKQNVGQRYVVVHEYYAFLATTFKSLPNYARYQVLSVDVNEAKSRQLAYFIADKLSEKYNFDLDDNGVVSESGTSRIASIRSIQLPISMGLVSGGGWQYSQNYEVRF